MKKSKVNKVSEIRDDKQMKIQLKGIKKEEKEAAKIKRLGFNRTVLII